MPNENKSMFANTISDFGSDGGTMNDCERYGMTWGCDKNCPVINRGECPEPVENAHILLEIKEQENANN